jgi:two-component system LytT family sensor kinase
MPEQHATTLLLKLAVAASLASLLVRFGFFRRLLLVEHRTLGQRFRLALLLSLAFGTGVLTRVVTGTYKAADLGLEGCLLAGLVGGYFTGLLSGVLVALPAMFLFRGELVSMPLFAGAGVLGGLLRDLAPDAEEIWRFSPILDRVFRRGLSGRVRLFHLSLFSAIVFVELLRWASIALFPQGAIFAAYGPADMGGWKMLAIVSATLFTVALPLKIWNHSRTEQKLEAQQRVLNEARLAVLTSQINPHFFFNTLNSIASLIRLDPDQARNLIYKLSNILRRAMRNQEHLSTLREELAFIEDYMSIEMTRFGDKLRFKKDIDPAALDRLVPSMLLQPVIENSVKHGLSKKIEGGVISVRCQLHGRRLRVVVEDDGVGIPENKLQSLFEQGIGISNLNERLKVLYGTDYKITVESKPGVGTRTEIEIPAPGPALAAAG